MLSQALFVGWGRAAYMSETPYTLKLVAKDEMYLNEIALTGHIHSWVKYITILKQLLLQQFLIAFTSPNPHFILFRCYPFLVHIFIEG